MRRTFLALTILLAGCLEREEVITVQPDGAVSMKVTIKADSEHELYQGDAVPNLERGWLVELRDEKDDDGVERYRLTAEQAFAPEAELPGDFARPTDVYREAVLEFPTTLKIEDRRDGVYYHFRRVYPARSWAQIEGPRQELIERIEEVIGDRELDELSEAEHRKLLSFYAGSELVRLRGFARDAFRDAAADAPQDVWLHLDREIAALVQGLDLEEMAALLLEAEDDPNAEQRLREIMDAMELSAAEAVQLVLTGSGWFSAARINDFMARYDYHRMKHRISADLVDDKIEIVVRMPGEIVAHNADTSSGPEARWKFDGGQVHDREVELMVTSVVRW